VRAIGDAGHLDRGLGGGGDHGPIEDVAIACAFGGVLGRELHLNLVGGHRPVALGAGDAKGGWLFGGVGCGDREKKGEEDERQAPCSKHASSAQSFLPK